MFYLTFQVNLNNVVTTLCEDRQSHLLMQSGGSGSVSGTQQLHHPPIRFCVEEMHLIRDETGEFKIPKPEHRHDNDKLFESEQDEIRKRGIIISEINHHGFICIKSCFLR